MNDLHDAIRTKTVIAPIAIGGNATKTGVVVDRQGYGGVEFIINYGAVTTTGSLVMVIVKDGDVTGTLTAVSDAYLQGTEVLASLLQGSRAVAGVGKEVTKRIGYKGNKRYVSADTVSTVSATTGCVGITALLHTPYNAPSANP